MKLHSTVEAVTARIRERSQVTRSACLERLTLAANRKPGADVNQFQAAGGPGFVIRELLDAGLMHADVLTVHAGGLREYTCVPATHPDTSGGALHWVAAGAIKDETIVRPVSAPFSASGGLKLLQGNLGRRVIKVSAVPDDRHVIEAPCRVFESQEALHVAFSAGELDRDVICVVRWQGPQANGMPELHKLTPRWPRWLMAM